MQSGDRLPERVLEWSVLDSGHGDRGVELARATSSSWGAHAAPARPGSAWPKAPAASTTPTSSTLAHNLVNAGEGDAYLRLGWEFNGTWYKWSVRNGPGAFAYELYFRNIVRAMRSVPGQSFKFVWNPNGGNSHGRPYNASLAYPGNSYVDLHRHRSLRRVVGPAPDPGQRLGGTAAPRRGGSIGWPRLPRRTASPSSSPSGAWPSATTATGLGDDPYFVNQFAVVDLRRTTWRGPTSSRWTTASRTTSPTAVSPMPWRRSRPTSADPPRPRSAPPIGPG